MAKPRKAKTEEQKPSESSRAVIHHQKLCISVDMENRRIFGHTEIKIAVPEGGYVALHADCMSISSITVDGEPAEFEYSPHYQLVEDESRWCSVSCSKSAADAACSTYISSLDKEMVPNLLISFRKSEESVKEQDQEDKGDVVMNSAGPFVNGCNSIAEDKNVKQIHIDYWIERAKTGIHFGENVMHTNNQIMRAHCWFPCIDNILQRCTFDLEFTVDSKFVAVSNGNLLYQVLSKDDPPRKTYVYRLSIPVSAEWISLAVAPFEILPDNHIGIISHMCLSSNFAKLQNTVGFFHNAYSHYEDYLSMSFPFGVYQQIFIPPEFSISSMSLGASMCIFSSQVLYDEKVIDQTIETRIKLAYALARQWFGVYITAEEPNDEWLLDGLAGFLSDSFIKKFLGNNEARYRRYKANCAVCKADVSGVTALSSSAAVCDLYGTQSIGLCGKVRSWKAVAVLQMLEKQMGPDSFRKILQIIVQRALDTARSARALSTKEFRHLANKVGNLERPFIKEFFPHWVESCGCPVLRAGLSYNKRRNMIELAVVRSCTAKSGPILFSNSDNGTREGDTGWPGMMSIRVHEMDGMYDHPVLPMAGETWQLLEIQCHSKLAPKRIQKPKKGSKPDGSDDNADNAPSDMRTSMDSPLLWLRIDPEMEYLAEINFHQPVQMWINQLEKDKDVVAQAQAIEALEKLPQLSFAVVTALSNFLNDPKVFWRVRIEAAYALAHTASEETDWIGVLHLVKFFKSRRFDADIGLPRPNDFHDVPEYFVLEAIPHAIALVRAADKKSPREAVEFVLQLLKYNDNSGNPYSDVFWLSALVQSIGELEFGQQSISVLSSLLKRIDRLLQFDSLMPSYNGILTISCIHALAQIALKMSSFVSLDRVCELIIPFRNSEKAPWGVRIEASKVLLNLEVYQQGLDAALSLFMKFLEDEPSLRGEAKLAVHMMHLCQENSESELANSVKAPTLLNLLHLLAGRKSYNNVFLRHHLFCILQILAGRPPTLYGVPKIQKQAIVVPETSSEQQGKTTSLKPRISKHQEIPDADTPILSLDAPVPIAEAPKEADTVSNCSERRANVFKIRVKPPGSSSKVDDADLPTEHARGRQNENTEAGPCSSVSVDAPTNRGADEALNTSTQNIEEVNSCHNDESRMSASIGTAKVSIKDEAARELQCTADSRKSDAADQSSPPFRRHDEEAVQRSGGLEGTFTNSRYHDVKPLPALDNQEARVEQKNDKYKKKKDKEKKRKREGEKDGSNDPDYLEKKRQKKEKKRKEKELAKMQKRDGRTSPLDLHYSTAEKQVTGNSRLGEPKKLEESTVKPGVRIGEPTSSAPRIRIKIKSRSLGNV